MSQPSFFDRVIEDESHESFSLMEQDIPDIQSAVKEMIDNALASGGGGSAEPNQRLIHEVLKLKGLGEFDTCSSSCVETRLPVAFNTGEMYEYVCEFAINVVSFATDTTGFNPYWRFDLSIDGFKIGEGQDVIIQQIDFTASRNTNDPKNVMCVGGYYRKPSVKDLPLQITGVESVSLNEPSSYTGDCYLTVKFLSSSKLI